MGDKYGHVLPRDYIDAVAPHVANLREGDDSDVGVSSGSDAVFDPETGRWRNPQTGAFEEGPDDG